MFISVSKALMRSQDYDACLRSVGDYLYRLGINNFIYYNDQQPFRIIKLLDTNQYFIPLIDHHRGGIELVEANQDHNYE